MNAELNAGSLQTSIDHAVQTMSRVRLGGHCPGVESADTVTQGWRFYGGANVETRVTTPEGHERVARFDARGMVTEEIDEAGQRTRYAYDPQLRRTRTVDPLGRPMESPQCGATTTDDPGLVDPGLGVPRPLAPNLKLIDAPAVAAHYEGPTRFVAAVLRQDYAGAQQYVEEIDAMADTSQRMREIYRLKFALDARGMYLLGPAQQWLAAQPQSDIARVLLGVSLVNGAAQARGTAYASETSPAQMARFRSRFEKARVHLEAVTARGGVAASLAHASLQLPYFYAGEADKGWASIDTLIGQAPQYGWLYFWATEFAQPKWAGEAASQRLQPWPNWLIATS